MKSHSIRFVHETIRDTAHGHDFRKEGSCWRSTADETIQVLEPQRSQYGDQYYINAAVYVRRLGTLDKPREHQCHIRARLESLFPEEERKAIERLLDFENDVDEVERHTALVKRMREHAVPFLKGCSTLDAIREQFNSGRLRGMAVRAALVELLDER